MPGASQAEYTAERQPWRTGFGAAALAFGSEGAIRRAPAASQPRREATAATPRSSPSGTEPPPAGPAGRTASPVANAPTSLSPPQRRPFARSSLGSEAPSGAGRATAFAATFRFASRQVSARPASERPCALARRSPDPANAKPADLFGRRAAFVMARAAAALRGSRLRLRLRRRRWRRGPRAAGSMRRRSRGRRSRAWRRRAGSRSRCGSNR